MYDLVGVYRGDWRRPLRAVELFRRDGTLVATLSVELLTQMVLHHVNGAALARVVARELGTRKPLARAETDRPRLRARNGRRLRGA